MTVNRLLNLPWRLSKAVSYTHLDVYKRQLIDRANEDKETAVHFLNQVDDADLAALMEDGKPKEEMPAAVSYTHL